MNFQTLVCFNVVNKIVICFCWCDKSDDKSGSEVNFCV